MPLKSYLIWTFSFLAGSFYCFTSTSHSRLIIQLYTRKGEKICSRRQRCSCSLSLFFFLFCWWHQTLLLSRVERCHEKKLGLWKIQQCNLSGCVNRREWRQGEGERKSTQRKIYSDGNFIEWKISEKSLPQKLCNYMDYRLSWGETFSLDNIS